MEIQRRLVLDANILIRVVLGRRVRQVILDHSDRVSFFAPRQPSLTHGATCQRCWRRLWPESPRETKMTGPSSRAP